MKLFSPFFQTFLKDVKAEHPWNMVFLANFPPSFEIFSNNVKEEHDLVTSSFLRRDDIYLCLFRKNLGIFLKYPHYETFSFLFEFSSIPNNCPFRFLRISIIPFISTISQNLFVTFLPIEFSIQI